MSELRECSINGELYTGTEAELEALVRRAAYRIAVQMWTRSSSPVCFACVLSDLQGFIDAVFALEPGEWRDRLMQEAADEMTTIVKVRPFAGRVGRA